jgi:8-oxo-dGTP pyrophosphatase MutT (NUDIX family)
MRKVACITFYDDKNRILIQDRSQIGKAKHPYGWFGGGLESGEDLKQGLKREVKEELDIDLKNFTPIFQRDYPEVDDKVTLFISKLPKGELKCFEGKPVLVSIKEARKLMSNLTHSAIDAVEKWLDKNVI